MKTPNKTVPVDDILKYANIVHSTIESKQTGAMKWVKITAINGASVQENDTTTQRHEQMEKTSFTIDMMKVIELLRARIANKENIYKHTQYLP